MKTDSNKAVIKVRNLGKSYGAMEVLRDISLDIAGREVVCIIGPSGSGKSTLLRCMAFLEQYDVGEVMIEDELLGYVETGGKRRLASRRELSRTRRHMGFVFQHFNLWPHKTALENVTMPLVLSRGLSKAEADASGREVLAKVGLDQQAKSYPSQLSGGQQQRVAIARALAMEPHFMMFDEPTSALDPELVGEVLKVMRDLADEGMTMVIVTHEMGFAAKVADRVAFLDQGSLVALGTPNEVFRGNDNPRLKQFLKSIVERNAIWTD